MFGRCRWMHRSTARIARMGITQTAVSARNFGTRATCSQHRNAPCFFDWNNVEIRTRSIMSYRGFHMSYRGESWPRRSHKRKDVHPVALSDLISDDIKWPLRLPPSTPSITLANVFSCRHGRRLSCGLPRIAVARRSRAASEASEASILLLWRNSI